MVPAERCGGRRGWRDLRRRLVRPDRRRAPDARWEGARTHLSDHAERPEAAASIRRSEHDQRSNPGLAQSGGQRAEQWLRAAQGERAGDAAGSKNVLADANPFHRARAIWLLAQLGPEGVQEVRRLLTDADPQVRVTAFRALRRIQSRVEDEARRLSQDSSPAVRREAALSLRGVPFEERRDVLVKLAEGYDGTDRWYLEALGIAAAGHEDAVYASWLPVLGHADPLEWTPRFSALAWRLHPARAIDAFAARAGSSRLTASARSQALVALGFINDPRAARAMAGLTGSALQDVASQAAWWMTYRKSNDWREYPVDGGSPSRPT